MSWKREAKERVVKGHHLQCPICNQTKFWTRLSLLNDTETGTLWWAKENKRADNYVCDNCGYVMWFLDTEEEK